MPFYAVAVGKNPGVYKTWDECLNQTKGYKKAKYKKFNTEAEALNFVKTAGAQNESLDADLPPTSSISYAIENLRPPVFSPPSKHSKALLKEDKLSQITEKLENFIEQTSKILSEFGKRLDKLETSVGSENISGRKRKNDTIEGDKINKSSKKKRGAETVDDSDEEISDKPEKNTLTNGSSEVDGPWGFHNNSAPGDFIVGPDGYTVVFTDGACSNNGRNGAKAGIGVWFNHNNPFNLAAPVSGSATNNNAEIQAATRAIEQANRAGIKRLNIHTDSQFMINCMTDWIKKWKKNNWMTSSGGPVKNKEQLVILDQAIESMQTVKWTHIRGHMGNVGNESADALARKGASMY